MSGPVTKRAAVPEPARYAFPAPCDQMEVKTPSERAWLLPELGQSPQSNVQSSRPGSLRSQSHHRCVSRPITRNLASCVLLQMRLCTRPMGRRPLDRRRRMRMRGIMCGSTVHCLARTRVSALLVVYCFRPSAGRGNNGHRPRPEQPQLNSTSTAGSECCCGSARRYCTGEANRQQGGMNGSS